jgi:uncharacterized protein YaaN involved in tellurite resistance
MTNDKVDKGYRALYNALCAAQLMQMDLRDSRDTAGAADAKKRADALSDQIDTLLSKELQDWGTEAEGLIPQLSRASQAAQSAVDQVAKDVQNAQKVGDAMKALDQLVTVAAKFLT